MKNFIAILLIFLGTILISYSLILAYQRLNPQRLSFKNYNTFKKKPNKKTVLPKKIIIKNLKIDLPVETMDIQDGKWPISQKGISYLFSSGSVGENGNAIFYGHNFDNLLGNLKSAKINDNVQIEMQNQKIYVYKISGMSIVKPNQTEVLKQSKEKMLTIYTCAGLFDEKRLVVTAKMIK